MLLSGEKGQALGTTADEQKHHSRSLGLLSLWSDVLAGRLINPNALRRKLIDTPWSHLLILRENNYKPNWLSDAVCLFGR